MRPCASCSDCTSRPAVAVLVGVEAQILQAREPRDQRQPAIVETVAVAEYAAHFVERQLERGMALGGEPLILAAP